MNGQQKGKMSLRARIALYAGVPVESSWRCVLGAVYVWGELHGPHGHRAGSG